MTDVNAIISDLKKKVINLKEDKSELIEELERKESVIHSLKNKFPGECSYGCNKYNKSVEEIVTAGNKHREKLLILKNVAEEQKEKIRILRNQKYELENHLDKLVDDLEIWRKSMFILSREILQRK